MASLQVYYILMDCIIYYHPCNTHYMYMYFHYQLEVVITLWLESYFRVSIYNIGLLIWPFQPFSLMPTLYYYYVHVIDSSRRLQPAMQQSVTQVIILSTH